MAVFWHIGVVAELLWLMAGVVVIAAEVIAGELVRLMIGVAAAGADGPVALGAPLAVDAAVFAVLSLGLVMVARSVLQRHLMRVSSSAPMWTFCSAGKRSLNPLWTRMAACAHRRAELVGTITGRSLGASRGQNGDGRGHLGCDSRCGRTVRRLPWTHQH